MGETILWLTLAHYLGDYPLQGDFLATTKGKFFYSLFVHSFIYSATVMAFFAFGASFEMWKFFVLLFSHMVIDNIKANSEDKSKALTSYLYIDQSLHLAIIYILYFLKL